MNLGDISEMVLIPSEKMIIESMYELQGYLQSIKKALKRGTVTLSEVPKYLDDVMEES